MPNPEGDIFTIHGAGHVAVRDRSIDLLDEDGDLIMTLSPFQAGEMAGAFARAVSKLPACAHHEATFPAMQIRMPLDGTRICGHCVSCGSPVVLTVAPLAPGERE
jgi:hypothetical protein